MKQSPNLCGAMFFQSPAAMYVFYLIMTDGEIRANGLGITPDLYKSSQAANRWYYDIMVATHTYPHEDIKALARQKLDELFGKMIHTTF